MNATLDPIDFVCRLNPVPAGSLRDLAAERADELLARLQASELANRSVSAPRRQHAYYLAVAAAVLTAVGAAGYAVGTRSGLQQTSSSSAADRHGGRRARARRVR